ncbi:hypothetical protein RRG08_036748 [Elysia crispata]|uniref:Uncharacterized protein n=1 Tax=Elysia crispata TaxID=231223 RepID=A0AAE1DFR0_9GAST|nr:hypothetical protein RRG08_036748 [Elysia crispata]
MARQKGDLLVRSMSEQRHTCYPLSQAEERGEVIPDDQGGMVSGSRKLKTRFTSAGARYACLSLYTTHRELRRLENDALPTEILCN